MDNIGFDPARWNHWFLLCCFAGVSFWGLYLSWRWGAETRLKRRQSRLARRLAMELHGVKSSLARSPQQRSKKKLVKNTVYEEFSISHSTGSRSDWQDAQK
ncbi:MAG: hypothetical protein WA885_05025 [Phormidesmis sp.]